MRRRVLLVDDEIAVLLTLKAVLEINGFDVETAASAREGRLKLRSREYNMVITDLRMESDQAGAAVIAAARTAACHPAVALLTAFPLADEDWQEMGADHMLVKPMHTRMLLEQIDRLMETHTLKLSREQAQRDLSEQRGRNKKIAAKKPSARKKAISVAAKIPSASARKPIAKKPAAQKRDATRKRA